MEHIEGVLARLPFHDRGDIRLGGHFEAETPEDAVDDEAAERFVSEVAGRGHGGGKHAVLRVAGIGYLAGPGHGHRGRINTLLLLVGRTLLRAFAQGILRIHTLEDQATEKDLRIGGRVSLVDIGVTEDDADPIENRELLRTGFDGGTGGFALVVAPVANPGLAEHVLTKASLVVPVIGDEGAFLRDAGESVRAGAGSDDRHAALDGGVKLRESTIIPLTET